jgi:hypothetical protein
MQKIIKILLTIIACINLKQSKANAESFSSIGSMNLLIDVSEQITHKIDNYMYEYNFHNTETIE